MLSFERRLVTSLLEDAEPEERAAIVGYVDGALGALPDFIRLGVVAESVAFSGWAAARRVVIRRRESADELLDRLERNPIGLVRQYPRLLRSLTMFAEQERLGSHHTEVASA
jgi:hypothetical protein